jgi:hypothetical protein
MNLDDRTELVRLIITSINRHARGDVAALAENIVAELEDRGYELCKPDLVSVLGRLTRRSPR